jgi:hypothetical protein
MRKFDFLASLPDGADRAAAIIAAMEAVIIWGRFTPIDYLYKVTSGKGQAVGVPMFESHDFLGRAAAPPRRCPVGSALGSLLHSEMFFP